MADSTLSAIRIKIRRLTQNPSVSNITDDEIDEYVNTFILYDMPNSLRLFSNTVDFKFITQPYIGEYAANTINVDDPLYDFPNKYTSFYGPAYCSGNNLLMTLDKQAFTCAYPLNKTISQLTTGNGITTVYNGTFASYPVLQKSVLITSIDANNTGIALIDVPTYDPFLGYMTTQGTLVEANTSTPAGTIDYVTGDYNIAFPIAPAAGQIIYSQTYPYVPSRPVSLFYYDDTFFVRPIPDQPYEIVLQADILPTQLLVSGDNPDLKFWWQYIAYGAAKKILEDRVDLDGVALIMPEFKQQELFVQRRSINQKSREKVKTIFNTGSYRKLYRRW